MRKKTLNWFLELPQPAQDRAIANTVRNNPKLLKYKTNSLEESIYGCFDLHTSQEANQYWKDVISAFNSTKPSKSVKETKVNRYEIILPKPLVLIDFNVKYCP